MADRTKIDPSLKDSLSGEQNGLPGLSADRRVWSISGFDIKLGDLPGDMIEALQTEMLDIQGPREEDTLSPRQRRIDNYKNQYSDWVHTAFFTEDRLRTLMMAVDSSRLAAMHIIYNYYYVELVENGEVVGRACRGSETTFQEITRENPRPPEPRLRIIGQEPIDRTVTRG